MDFRIFLAYVLKFCLYIRTSKSGFYFDGPRIHCIISYYLWCVQHLKSKHIKMVYNRGSKRKRRGTNRIAKSRIQKLSKIIDNCYCHTASSNKHNKRKHRKLTQHLCSRLVCLYYILFSIIFIRFSWFFFIFCSLEPKNSTSCKMSI